jgi:hypothetical protein
MRLLAYTSKWQIIISAFALSKTYISINAVTQKENKLEEKSCPQL